MWKAQLSRRDKVPRFEDPRRQVLLPLPSRSLLPVCKTVGRLEKAHSATRRFADLQAIPIKIKQAIQLR
jgi:hypothetical protein